uniref:DUF7869 domain-containing protein n=1 Tax=Romanomermis culicivorax TaxID=13658 RepID=A0A915KHJ9_ROMCU
MQVKKGKKKIVIWSDNCGRQNRNKFSMSMYHKLVQETPNLELIQHCYLETGHMQMSVDSMHSLIERVSKQATIYSPIEWCNVIALARSKKLYNVVCLSHHDFVDLKCVKKTNQKQWTNRLMVLKLIG